MSEISVDIHGWINPTCPKCECVMEFNYTSWYKLGKQITEYPNLNMYCRRCHYAVHTYPGTIDCDNGEESERMPTFVCYNSPDSLDLEEEE